MRILRCLIAGAAVAATSAVASAQKFGTVELGAFAHYTIVKNDANLGEHSTGWGARGGLFLAKWLEGEIEYGRGTVANGGVRYPDPHWSPMRIYGTLNLPIASRVKLLLGVGAVDTYGDDITNNPFEEGVTALAGLRFCVGDAWSIRPEVVFDRTPEPAAWMVRNYQAPANGQVSTRWGLRIGVSRFFVRGTTTCRGSEKPVTRMPEPRPSAAPPPLPAAPPVTAAPPPPAPTPRPVSASLSASPTRLVSGNSSTLTWNSSNATQCTAPWTTGTMTSGTQTVYPTSTTTYTINCTGAGVSNSANATITVTQPPPPPPAPKELLRLSGVHFDFDKSTIKPLGKKILDSGVVILKNSPSTHIEIQGHTDSRGSDAYNQALSERRANAVRDYLISKGISASRLTIRGFGESQPVESNDTDAGRAQNRRVVLIDMGG